MSALAAVLATLAFGAGVHAWTRRTGSRLP